MTSQRATIKIANISNIPATVFQDKLKTYVGLMIAGAEFPPITVRRATKTYWLLDGAHRVTARLKCGFTDIFAIILE